MDVTPNLDGHHNRPTRHDPRESTRDIRLRCRRQMRALAGVIVLLLLLFWYSVTLGAGSRISNLGDNTPVGFAVEIDRGALVIGRIFPNWQRAFAPPTAALPHLTATGEPIRRFHALGILFVHVPRSITAVQINLIWMFVPTLMLFIVPVRAWIRRRRSEKRMAIGQCVECGYDLREAQGRCVECGTPLCAEASAALGRVKRARTAAGLPAPTGC